MSNTNTGGPAFPFQTFDTGNGTRIVGSTGMDLRDYFAAKAIQGLCAGFAVPDGGWPDSSHPEDYEVVAGHAYLMADAMLKAREQ